MDVDCENFPGQCREYRSLISGAGAHFKNPMIGVDLEKLRHESHDVRLGYCLRVLNRQGIVIVSAKSVIRGNELMSRDGAHRIQNSVIVNSPVSKLRFNHRLTYDVPFGLHNSIIMIDYFRFRGGD